MRKSSPRLPWKRGPIAWKIRQSADDLLIGIQAHPCEFFSLREAAKALKVSTQPLRDWIKRGQLDRGGPRMQISRRELIRFVDWLRQRAEAFDPQRYSERLYSKDGMRPFPFSKLRRSQFSWPKGSAALAPKEIAALVGCHPSLVIKAIQRGLLRGRNRTRCRWEITRQAWSSAFPLTNFPK